MPELAGARSLECKGTDQKQQNALLVLPMTDENKADGMSYLCDPVHLLCIHPHDQPTAAASAVLAAPTSMRRQVRSPPKSII